MSGGTIVLRPFAPVDQAVVKELIVSGLEEHWGFRDLTKNPDLDDIATSYAHGTFLVAWQDGQVVGTGALIPRENAVAQIVRMSVAAPRRRSGIGSIILNELCRRAREAGARRVILETTATWTDVMAFYRRHGFEVTHHADGNAHFALDLTSNPAAGSR